MENHVVVRKRAGKVAGIVYPKHKGAERAGGILFCEGAARQEKPVGVAIAGDVVADYRAWVIDASSFGKTHVIVRVDYRSAKATIAEPEKPRTTPLESMNSPTMSPLSLIFWGKVLFPAPG